MLPLFRLFLKIFVPLIIKISQVKIYLHLFSKTKSHQTQYWQGFDQKKLKLYHQLP